jgi:hypothetical protein
MAMLSSKNIFLSTQPSGNLSNVDDQINKFRACLNNIPLQTDINTYAKISLVDFQMYNNIPNINRNNRTCVIVLTTTAGDVYTKVADMAEGNQAFGSPMANALAFNIRDKIRAITDADGATPFSSGVELEAGSVVPSGTGRLNAGDGRIRFTIVFSSPAPAVSSIILQMRNYNIGQEPVTEDNLPVNFSDSYALFGGKRVVSATDTKNSYSVNISGQEFSFNAPYPMQTSTMPFVYLRCAEVLDNLESENYQAGTLNGSDTHITGSNILAKIPVGIAGDGDGDEVIQYLGDTATPYFILSDNRVISELFFFLTDEHGRTLPAVDDLQTTLGNLFCNMTINFSTYSRGNTQVENNNIENNNLSNAMIQQGVR